MHINVKSSGIDKATRMAIAMVKRNLSICKIVYFTEWFYEHYHRILMPFNFYSICSSNIVTEKQISQVSATKSNASFDFNRAPEIDKTIHDINTIINKEGKNELENRIINVIDLFILIEKDTPLYVRFMICIISLETLLISKSDKDYLGWKLSEKISFILGTSEFWIRIYNKIGDDHLFPSHAPIPKEAANNNAENRSSLYYKMRDLYNKRSKFAHGTKNKDDEITENDYFLAYSFVRLIMMAMLDLINKGYTHIAKKSNGDKSYLDMYIEKMKYR